MGEFSIRTDHTAQLADLKAVLSRIAKARGLNDPEMQAQIIRNKLVRSIEQYRSSVACIRQYDHFLEPWLILMNRPDHWLCYLIRLTQNKRTIGRRRGSVSGTRATAIADATTIESLSQLSPVEQRTFAILKGDGAPRKNTKHPVEKRALALAEAVKAEWFPKATALGRPKGRWQRKSEGTPERSFDDEKPPLTILDVVLIATPIIENFALGRITRKNETFDALYWLIRAHSDIIQRHTANRALQISQKSVYQALRRSRSKVD
ncbi:MAG: hypothetical protein ACLP19_12115 [Xanthobacteraceae bacterium]